MPYTAGSIASYLEKMNKDYYGRRTWSQQFGGIDLAKQMSIEGLKTDFGKAVGSAYDSSLRNQNIIAASNLIQGNKDLAFEQNQQALQEAYDSYLKNYKLGVQDIQDAAIQQQAIVNQNLLKQGEMFSRYATSHIDYLYDLWNKYESGEITGEFFNNPKFANYMTNQYDELGNVIVDENGEALQTIIGRSELENLMFDANDRLTLAGKSFFEQMEYDELLRGNSFSDYLSQADPELYQWALSENQYNYAPNKFGENTMAGTFREMTGRESIDEVFDAADVFAGTTEGTMEQGFDKILGTLNNLSDAYASGDEATINKSVAEFSEEITSLIQTYDLEKDLLTELNKKGYKYTSVDDFLVEDSIELNHTNLVSALVNAVVNKKQRIETEFYEKEMTSDGVIQAYDPLTAKHSGYYNYGLNDNTTASFLSSAKSSGNVNDAANTTFSTTYGGVKYNLETGNKTLDPSVVKQLSTKVYNSMGRALQAGDTFYYNDALWVVTDSGVVRNVHNKFGDDSYSNLIRLFRDGSYTVRKRDAVAGSVPVIYYQDGSNSVTNALNESKSHRGRR